MKLGYRYLGPSVAITRDHDIAVGITNMEEPSKFDLCVALIAVTC